MFITFDFKCSTCGDIRERFVRRKDMDTQMCGCQSIKPMVRLPAGTKTTFRYADSKLKE